ncbi:zeta toxin family protein [Streptomyces sp. JV184]|uniref:zeta toxin family protein n=1 Tax=Streptomyces sp. JV184 TaxID=858637 RepID=UPI002E778A3B|nr:zeta toxin family protein [Streptomyces sp. JV184]MEE1743759.1 zeta toxin family protein [Streptomyces sp. JV184]
MSELGSASDVPPSPPPPSEAGGAYEDGDEPSEPEGGTGQPDLNRQPEGEGDDGNAPSLRNRVDALPPPDSNTWEDGDAVGYETEAGQSADQSSSARTTDQAGPAAQTETDTGFSRSDCPEPELEPEPGPEPGRETEPGPEGGAESQAEHDHPNPAVPEDAAKEGEPLEPGMAPEADRDAREETAETTHGEGAEADDESANTMDSVDEDVTKVGVPTADADEQAANAMDEAVAGTTVDARSQETAQDLTSDRPSDVPGADEDGAREASWEERDPWPDSEPDGELGAEADFNAKVDSGSALFDRETSDTVPNRSRSERPEEDDPATDAGSGWRTEIPPEAIEQIYAEKIRPMLFGNDRRQDPLAEAQDPDQASAREDKPHVVAFVGGPPGVGKSRATAEVKRDIRDEYGTDPVSIDADAFRRHHPDYDAVMKKSPQDMPAVTAQAIGRWTEMAISEARSNNQNVIIEGTFRNPDTLLNTATRFAPRWRRDVHVVAEPEEVSRLGTVSRTLSEGRFTPATSHNEAFTNNPTTVGRAFESGLFDRITLSTRSERVMESTRESGQYNPGSAEFGDRLQEVRTAAMAPEKARGHLKAYDDTMRGYIASNLVNPSTTPDLSRVTRDAMGVRSGLDLSLPERDAFAAGIYSYQVNIEFPDKIHKSLMPRDSH